MKTADVQIIQRLNEIYDAQTGGLASSFAAITGDPSDNTALDTALNLKQTAAQVQALIDDGKYVINVKDAPYNAAGDGVTDDTIAIQAACNAAKNVYAPANGYSNGNVAAVVIIPAGMFITTDDITVSAGVRVRGAGSLNTIIRNTSTNSTFVFAENLSLGILQPVEISGITISYSAANAGSIAIDINGLSQLAMPIIHDVLVFGAGIGIRLQNTINADLENVLCRNGISHGVQMVASNNAASVKSCYMSVNAGYGWNVDATYSHFSGCAADSNTLGGYSVHDSNSCTFTSCGAEANGANQWTITDSVSCSFNRIYVQGIAGSDHGIAIDGGTDITINGVNLNPSGNTNGYSLFLDNAPVGLSVTIDYLASFGLGGCNNVGLIEYSYIGRILTITKSGAGVNNLVVFKNPYNVTNANHGSSFQFMGASGYAQALISAYENPATNIGGSLKLQTYTDAGDLNPGITINRTGGTTIGAGPSFKNIRHGTTSAMIAGVVTVTDTGCTADTRYFFTTHTLGTVILPGSYYASTRTASTSFVITSSQANDTSTVDWFAVEP